MLAGARRACPPPPLLEAAHSGAVASSCIPAMHCSEQPRLCLPHQRAAEISSHLFDALRRPQRPLCSNAAGALAAAPAAFLQPAQLLGMAAGGAELAAADAQQLEQLGRGICRNLLLHQQMQPRFPSLGPQCPLLARKFGDGTQKVGAREVLLIWSCFASLWSRGQGQHGRSSLRPGSCHAHATTSKPCAPVVQAALMALAPCDSPTLILNDGRCGSEGPALQQLRRLWWHWAPWVLVASAALTALPLLAVLAAPLWALPWRLARVRRQGAGMTAPLLDAV